MTDWKPRVPTSRRNQYREIVESLANDIAAGILRPGQRLPTHRELARTIGIAVGTVSKAYAEAKRRGYISSRVGRGTFVLEDPWSERRRLRPDQEDSNRIDLSFNSPVPGPVHFKALAAALRKVAQSDEPLALWRYHRPWLGLDRHRQAAAAWIGRFGLAADAADVAVVSGSQHAASVILLASASPGDVILTDELTDPGTKLLAGALHLSLKGVPMDDAGLLPDAFEAACKAEKVRALLCVPDHHSPTLAVMPEDRRREIARIARAFGVTLIENAVYRPFLEQAPPPLSSFAPELSYYFTSLSKIIAPGLRVGFLAAPPGRSGQLVLGMGATSWMTPPITAEVATLWIEEGTADRLVTWQRRELAARNRLAAELLGGLPFRALPSGLHAWLRLPHPWRAASVVSQARSLGVLVTPAEVFATGQMAAPHAVRISLGGAAPSREALATGIGVLTGILRGKAETGYAIM